MRRSNAGHFQPAAWAPGTFVCLAHPHFPGEASSRYKSSLGKGMTVTECDLLLASAQWSHDPEHGLLFPQVAKFALCLVRNLSHPMPCTVISISERYWQ